MKSDVKKFILLECERARKEERDRIYDMIEKVLDKVDGLQVSTSEMFQLLSELNA